MNKEIFIPVLGESISEVIVGQFIAHDGSFVKENEEIIELETDKANQSLYAPATGQLHWSVKAGERLPVGAKLGYIEVGAVGASPFTPTPETPAAALPLVKKGERREAMSPLRAAIARRLVKALHEAAMLTTFNEVDMSVIMTLRKQHQEAFQKQFGIKLGLMSFFIKAVVEGLKQFPIFNAYIDGNDLVYRSEYNLSIAVSTEKGLTVPVLRGVDTLPLHAIESALAQYAHKAREGKLAIADLEGGGFTLTNGGVYGSLLSTPLLNPPQVGILGMHKIMDRAVVHDQTIVIRPMMYLALSYDHRAVDGQDAVRFLIHIKSTLESFTAEDL